MAIDDLALLVLHDDDIAVERTDSAGDPRLVLQDDGDRSFLGPVRVQHLVKEIGFHGGVPSIG